MVYFHIADMEIDTPIQRQTENRPVMHTCDIINTRRTHSSDPRCVRILGARFSNMICDMLTYGDVLNIGRQADRHAVWDFEPRG